MDNNREPSEVPASGSPAEPKSADSRGTPVASLQAALRRARLENAEQSDAIVELRNAEGARLDMLREHLAPIVAQAREHSDIFDLALSQGERPRLFVDMIAFVEMARDRRTYRFAQDTSHGRVLIAEDDSVDRMTRTIADYIARRLVEREKALAADSLFGLASARAVGVSPAGPAPARTEEDAAARAMRAVVPEVAPPRAPMRVSQILGRVFLFLIEALGSAAFFGLIAVAGWWLWTHYGH